MRAFRNSSALAALAFALATTPALHAQETTGTIRGDVVSDAGAPVAGATVTITHTPTGTRSTQTTDANGNFNASGLRLGGPFTVVVTAAGFDQADAEVALVKANEPTRVAVSLSPEGQTIVVTGTRRRSVIQIATGPATSLNREDIAGIATINRDIRDLARRDPLVTLDPTNSRAISIAGQNNRFNRITVDGVLFGDPFGLNNGGLASSSGPIPLDAVCEFTVEVAPSDIRNGNFQGGAINTQLCSGSNDITGQGFFTYSDDSLAGDTTRGALVARTFTRKAFGGQLTGPIIKDKLFLAVTYEGQRDTQPTLVGPAGENFSTPLPQVSRAEVDNVRNILRTRYGYDALDVATAVPEKDDKIVAKADLNITEGHRASLLLGYNKGTILAGQTGQATAATTNPSLALQSNNYTQGNENYFGAFELNNEWSDSFSTQTRVTYQDYTRLQVPFAGRAFGQFTVCLDPTNPVYTSPAGTPGGSTVTGSPTSCLQPTAPAGVVAAPNEGQITLGPDISRQTNTLDSQLFNVEFSARIKKNDHDVQILFARNQQDINNNFQQNTSGGFYFDSIADLQAGRVGSLTLNVPVNGDPNSGAAIFDNINWVFGVQDTWDVNDQLTLLYGFRYDLYEANETPAFNANFLARNGFRNNVTLNGRALFQPRLAFNYRANDRLRFSGSAGIIGGGNPNVWVSNSYANTGTSFVQFQAQRTGTGATFNNANPSLPLALTNNTTGGPGIPQAFRDFVTTGALALANVNAIDPSFEIPSQWRFSLRGDYTADLGALGDEWNLGFDAIYSDIRNSTTWTDLRSVTNTVQATLPDGRPRYQQRTGAVDNNADVLLLNSTRGYSYNLVARFNKDFDNGLYLNGSYTFQRAKDVNSGTSSVAISNYGQTAGSDPNQSAYGTSNYQIDNTIKLGAGFSRSFFADAMTRFDMFFESRSGQRFSYTVQDSTTGRSAVFGVTGANNRYLMYVPTSATDPLVTFAAGSIGGVAQTAAQAAALFDQIVTSSKLGEFRGQIAPKNLGRSPRFNKLDLRISQEIPLPYKTKVELFGDIENVLNLIDSDWGSLRQVGFPYYAQVANVTCLTTLTGTVASTVSTPCARYQYNNIRNPAFTSDNVSLWGIRVGARFKF
jgi:hypothetical protein